MRQHDEIIRLIEEGRYDTADRLIKDAQKNMSIDESLPLARLQISVSEKVGPSSSLKKNRFRLLEHLQAKGPKKEIVEQAWLLLGRPKNFEAIRHLKIAMNSLSVKTTLLFLWEALIELGELQEADEVGRWYVQFLIEGKHLDDFEKFIQLEKRYGRINISSKEKAIHYINQGEQGKLLQELTQLDLGDQIDLVNMIYGHIDYPGQELSEFLLGTYFKKLKLKKEQSRDLRRPRKDFVNIAYQYLIRFPEGEKGLVSISEFASLFNLTAMLKKIVLLIKGSKSEELKERVKGIERTLKKIPEVIEDEGSVEEYDLGADLFEESDAEANRIKLLERDINYLINNGEMDKAKVLVRELENIDSENTILMDFTQKLEVSRLGREENLDVIEERLRKSLAKYITTPVVEESEVSIGKSIEYIEKEILQDNYIDILSGLITMECHDAASKLIDRVDRDHIVGSTLKEKLRYEYLRVVNLKDLSRDHDALAIADEIVRTWPVSKSEKIAFMFLMVDIYIFQNKHDFALGVARGILALSPGHARASLKVNELEEC